MNSIVQSPSNSLFALEAISSSRSKVKSPEGCELCQHCKLLRALLRPRNAERQNCLDHAQGEKRDVEQS